MGKVVLIVVGMGITNKVDAMSKKEEKKKLTIEMLIRDRLNRGDSLNRAVALAGNAMQESGGDASIKQRNSKKSDAEWFKKTRAGRGTGLMQWDDRRFSLKKFADKQGEDWRDANLQLDFLDFELKGPEKRNIKKVNMEDSVEKQTKDISKYFLRPGKPHNETRVAHAKKLKEEYKDMPKQIQATKTKSSMYTLPQHLQVEAAKKKLKNDMPENYVMLRDE